MIIFIILWKGWALKFTNFSQNYLYQQFDDLFEHLINKDITKLDISARQDLIQTKNERTPNMGHNVVGPQNYRKIWLYIVLRPKVPENHQKCIFAIFEFYNSFKLYFCDSMLSVRKNYVSQSNTLPFAEKVKKLLWEEPQKHF